jgi:hypothetical protein
MLPGEAFLFSEGREALLLGDTTKYHSSVVKRTLGKSHDFDCAFDYDLIGQILFDFRSHSHLTFLREVEVMTVTLVMTKVMTTFITRYLPLTFVFVYFRLLHHRDALQLPHVKE